MTPTEEPRPEVELASLVADKKPAGRIEDFLDGHSASDVALALSRLSPPEATAVLTTLPAEEAASLVESLPDAQAVDLLERLDPADAAAIVNELPSAERADVLGDLDEEDAAAILDRMAPEEAEDARRLSAYAEDEAGSLMVTEVLRYPESFTVSDVIDDLRANAHAYRDYDVQYAYVQDADERLTGVLRQRELLLADRDTPISELMIRDPVSVRDTTSLDDLADLFDRHHYLGVPVVDEVGRLLGVVQKAAVDEAWGEQQESSFLKTQGIIDGEEIRSMPLLRRSRRRLAWLSTNILLNMAAASIIAMFQETLSAVIALAVFLPIISDMSGCSGSQAVAVSLRELSLGLVRPQELLRTWLKEASVGILNGVVLGFLIGLVAWLWKGNPYLGAVVGAALALNTIVAVSIGGLVPLVLKRLRVDPAIASGPILTTLTDMCGFLFVLGFATLLLERLT